MKKTLIISLVCIVSFNTNIFSQEHILKQIEENNTLLSSLRSLTEAEKIGNKVGLTPENPEIEFAKMLSGEEVTELEVTQSFDFPTTYYQRKKYTDKLNSQSELKYLIERKNILLEAKIICIQLTFSNALAEQLKQQMELTKQISDAYLKRYEVGEVSILDLNKSKYDYLNAQKDYNDVVIERNSLLEELKRLNGGIAINFTNNNFSEIMLPADFEAWYNAQKANNQELLYLNREIAVSKNNEKLQRAINLPKITAGYRMEKLPNVSSHGVILGLSVPLWENRNTVKQIKAQTKAYEQAEADANLQHYHQTKAIYQKAVELQLMTNEFKNFQLSDNTVVLLKKSLDKGEISLIDFILELGIYYELVQNKLEMERDFHLVVAEMEQWNL
ncbi:cobalt-zinc-cadmium efflux system outer membrane protein [Dysgonomonadaceae bacterium PH5-43]|nr:cobalt-zinc-cadmium efflux system outer membrane protein [Dysgonomonadaceae bacterium PH5-43]